jgi:hypothetical protein
MEFNNKSTVLNNPSVYSNEVYTIACNYSGRDYNRHIGKFVIDELLQKMSDEDAAEFLSYANLLVFIDHGMFSSTVNYLKTLTFTGTLENIRLWLIEILSASDSVGN